MNRLASPRKKLAPGLSQKPGFKHVAIAKGKGRNAREGFAVLHHGHAGEHLTRVDHAEKALVVLGQLVHSLMGLDDCDI